MAITWDTKITPIDITNNVASVQGTRTDSEDAENPRTYNVPRAVIDTPAQKLAVMDEIWAKHQAAMTEETVISNFVNALEVQANANLEARE